MARAARCTDIPASFTLHETATVMNLDGTVALDGANNPVTAPSAIVGDGNDVYSANASIKICGTRDGILNLLTGQRKISAILPSPVANSGANAATPPPGKYTANGVINVRNLVCQGCASPGQPFVTRAGVELDSMFNGLTYHVWNMPAIDISTLPFAPDSDGDSSAVSLSNSPNVTSLVIVLPQPYNCTQGIYPSWIVRSTLPNQGSQPSYVALATLVDTTKNNQTTTSAGQFPMPFEYQIQALACFHPY
jgi:hypothetical protein